MKVTKEQYKFAQNRVEELLPLVSDEMSANHPMVIELSLAEKEMTQKQLAVQLGVSPSRISDYISGRAEPTLKIARLLCRILNIQPAAMLGF